MQNVAQGLQIQLSAGTLTAGQTFSVKAYVPTVQAAQDASVTLGSGAGALTVSSPTNQINNLIAGVTLQLQGASPNTPVSVTVASNTSGAQTAIDNFVSDYNSLMSFINQDDSYDATTNTAGPLFGNSDISQIVHQLQNMVQGVVPGANPKANQLGALGITFDSSGQLQVNDTTLGNVLNGGISGVSLTDIKNLFGMSAASNNPGVTFIAGSNQTKASTTPYTVNITHAATQASITATNSVPTSTQIDSSNDTFTLSLDGQSTTLTLADGTYTQTALAQMLQSAINSDSDLSGRQISVGVQGGQLTFTSVSFGSGSQISIGSGSANSALGLTGTENNVGVDVAGNYVVNGVTEPAQGFGQFLTGSQSNANTSGLEVKVTLSPSQVGTGTQANLTVSNGIASQLSGLLNQMTDPQTGRLTTIDNSFNTELTSLQTQQTQLTNAMNAKQQQLETEFANMETTLAQLQSASMPSPDCPAVRRRCLRRICLPRHHLPRHPRHRIRTAVVEMNLGTTKRKSLHERICSLQESPGDADDAHRSHSRALSQGARKFRPSTGSAFAAKARRRSAIAIADAIDGKCHGLRVAWLP